MAYGAGRFSSVNAGFSLVEILVVMVIIAGLTGIAWSGFIGLRTTMFLYQSAQMVRSDIVYAQRSAMLVDRQLGESWIHGIGVGMYEFESDQNRTYSLFKFCSPDFNYSDYDDGIKLFPDYLSFQHFRDEPPSGLLNSDCRTPGLAMVAGKREVRARGGQVDVCTTNLAFPNLSNKQYLNQIKSIIFESVNGRPHFYDRNGAEISSTDPVHSEFDGVRLTYFIGNRYSSVAIKENGEIIYEGYDSRITNPCVLTP